MHGITTSTTVVSLLYHITQMGSLVCVLCRSRRALEHRKNMDEDRLAELEQMVKDANDSVIETEKRFAEVCSVAVVNCRIFTGIFFLCSNTLSVL